MELLPEFRIGWLNGWLPIALLAAVEGILFLIFPKEVVKRLWDRSGWGPKQAAFVVAGKLFALGLLILLIITPLKIGSSVFVVGALLAILSLVGLTKALLDFRNTPLQQPVTRGLYRFSRHPQTAMASLVLLGACIGTGSWVAVAFWTIARLLEHFGILAEEEVCKKRYGEAYLIYLNQVPRYFLCI
jgi:protein-S-isoprenylcysteine O-methyltransferase Ste14